MTRFLALLKQHSIAQSAALHLAPGLLALVTYLTVFAPLSAAMGFPRQMGFVLMDVFVLIPALLIPLFYLGHLKNRRWTLDEVVLNRRRLSAKRLIAILAALAVWGGIVMALLSWTHDALVHHVFYWLPDSLLALEKTDTTKYPLNVLIATRLASLVFVGVIGPLAEELYFRGFLLPRVSRMGAFAAVWQGVLFAGYHFLSPWDFVWRVCVLVPAIYAVQRNQSISITIWGHCVGNTIGEIVALIGLL
jgi:membrane protease YdiL (CAAX protease family)